MMPVRPDIDTQEKRVKLLYAWLKLGKEHLPEVTLVNGDYKGNNDRPDYVFGSDVFSGEYSWEHIPDYKEFNRNVIANGEMAQCIAATDPSDQERVGLFDMGGMMMLSAYAKKMTGNHMAVFSRLYEEFDKLKV